MNLSKTTSCGHCGNIAPMEVKGSVGDIVSEGDDDHGYWEYGTYYGILKCPACHKVNIVAYGWHDGMESDDEISYELLYPNNEGMPIGLPDEVASTYLAAEKVKNIDVNAYAILMRRLLEQVCLDRSANGSSLASMLGDLAAKGEIPVKLVDVAKGLRHFGNIGAHAGSGNLSEREIPIVRALTKAILEYIYSAPHLADIAEKKLQQIKKS